MNVKQRINTKTAVYTAICTALISVLAQISIPLPGGVPLTLQTFAIAIVGFLLGAKGGLFAVVIYIALGAIGAPVFSSFTGGIGKIIGVTGGFIWGFIPFVALVGLGKGLKPKAAILCSIAGLFFCHLLGTAQYTLISGVSFGNAALVVSVPYIVKDVLSVILAWFVVKRISDRIVIRL